MQTPRISEPVTLKDRMIALSTMPANADIRVRDKVVGRGSYNLVVPAGGCISADVTAPSYALGARTSVMVPSCPRRPPSSCHSTTPTRHP